MTHIKKMKQWLEVLEEAVHYTSAPVWSPSMTKECNEAIASLRQAIAEAEKQEPVAWRTYTGRGYYVIDPTLEEAQKNWPDRTHQPLYTHPPQRTEQEPVIDKSAAIRIATALGWEPKREWVGLTDEEIQAVLDKPEPFYDTMFWFARTIERKLKEKNT